MRRDALALVEAKVQRPVLLRPEASMRVVKLRARDPKVQQHAFGSGVCLSNEAEETVELGPLEIKNQACVGRALVQKRYSTGISPGDFGGFLGHYSFYRQTKTNTGRGSSS